MPEEVFQSGPFTRDVRVLVDEALKLKPNEVWTYKQISDALERTVDGSDGALQEAIKRLARDHTTELKNIRKVGYVRLDDAGVVAQAGPDRQGIHRRVKRAVMRASNIRDWEALSDRHKLEATAHRSLLGLIHHVTRPSVIKQVRDEAETKRAELDVDSVIALIRGNRGIKE